MTRLLRISTLLFLTTLARGQQPGAMDLVKERFAALDKNGDGKISLEESPRPDLMPRVDTDGDGQASLTEYAAFVKSLPRRPGKPDPVKRDLPPATAGSDGSPFDAAAKYLESKNGHAMLVYLDGRLVFERYLNGYEPTTPHQLASGTKSFSGAMAVAAVQDGFLDLDEKVADTITEWKADERKSRITVRQLISLTSGIAGGDNGSVPSYAEAVKMANAIAEPGTKFSYGPIPFQCFGELMRRKLEPRGESVEAYLARRILKPIGLEPEFWRKDADGNIHLPSGAFLTPGEWARFGLFIQRGGQWSGEQILDLELLKECFRGSKTHPTYGLTFWLPGKGQEFADAKGYQETEFLKFVLGDLEKVRELKGE